MPERVDRITNASVYVLEVGPPQANQLQTLEDLELKGLVGLYRVGEKNRDQIKKDQASYLAQSDFLPTPSVMKGFMEPLGSPRMPLTSRGVDLSRS
ncbi:MAG: hypothetical protein KQJ78_18185 [Deltaproteobacteria bacterium]|nr:hypothetical protein [Deltaproteobacteria bacterium]